MIIPILLIAIQVVKEDKNKILVRADITESTQWFSVKKKSTTLHSEESALGPVVLERIVHF